MGLFVGLIGDLFGFDGDCVSDGRGNRGWSSWKLHDLLINSKFVNNSVNHYPTTCIASLFQHKLTGDSIKVRLLTVDMCQKLQTLPKNMIKPEYEVNIEKQVYKCKMF